ncbi:hypothetical protein D0T49_01205 [Paludibacter sp. 221]|uniref:hypothetical protein n=1 Tax=Paludibacter sp. 221 TaxID=2302939 RepID=UPI0013D7E97A|nr:hypothetical protein [Paludibacter sp. 221]NDV45668.1 hypothetical protein [Paludibacter sp. 221]
MKKQFLFLILLLSIAINNAQNVDCNQSVWMNRFKKLLPKDICIPQGNYHITRIYDTTDVNEDGLDDFIFKWNKNPLDDGDTTFVSVYIQNVDSTFSLLRTFSHLYPIYIREYSSYYYTPKDTTLILLQKKYEDMYPFRNLEFKKDVIILTIRSEAKEDLVLTYRFNLEKQNWLYENAELHDYALNEITPIDLRDKVGPSIDNFTYFYWEE